MQLKNSPSSYPSLDQQQRGRRGVGVVTDTAHGGVEQSVARWTHDPEVAGSSPASATEEKRDMIG